MSRNLRSPNARRVLAILFGIAILAGGQIAVAQDQYPTRPIKLDVPFAPGGTTDAYARKYAERMSRELGQQMYVENKAGAAGSISAADVAHANPDGYTLGFITSTTLALLPSIATDLSFNVDKDFAFISLVGVMPLILAVNSEFPAKNLAELIAVLKANPGKYSVGTSGTGGPPHLACELFKIMAGVDVLHVPYKGSGPALYDALAGINPIFFDTFVTIQPHEKAGKMRTLAILSDKRSDVDPSVPTTAEAGMPGLTAGTFQVVLAPAKTPRNVLEALEKATAKVLSDPSFQKEALAMSIDPTAGYDPEKTRVYILGERAKWAPIIKASGATLQ